MKTLTGFAKARYDDSLLEELCRIEEGEEFSTHAGMDQRKWNITPAQWRQAIDQAIAAKQLEILENA